MKQSRIIISRKQVWRDSLRNYIVVINGEKTTKIKGDETIEIIVEPGEIELFLKIDFFLRSRKIKFKISPGEKVYFDCQGLTGWRSWFSFLVLLFTFHLYIDLELVRRE